MTDWPHAPAHRLTEAGAYIVTTGTYLKKALFIDPERLTLLQDTLFSMASQFGWNLQAWALFPTHYHFVAVSPDNPTSLRLLLKHLHGSTAVALNRLDGVTGRKVWHEFWDTHLTYEKSYLARLNYVHHNPVKHGLVQVASQYPWCSASWFERTATPAFVHTVSSFRTDRVNVPDDF
jgi:putative transposase